MQVTVKTKYLFIKNRNTPTPEKRAVKLAEILYIFFLLKAGEYSNF